MKKTIGVIGAGQMGNGIAHVFAQHQHPVILCDVTEARLAAALAVIRNNLHRQSRKGLVEAGEIDEIINRIFLSTRLTDLAAADARKRAAATAPILNVAAFASVFDSHAL